MKDKLKICPYRVACIARVYGYCCAEETSIIKNNCITNNARYLHECRNSNCIYNVSMVCKCIDLSEGEECKSYKE